MTRWTGKVVGGVLGAMTLGPVGAALGAIFGHQFDIDSGEAERLRNQRQRFTPPPREHLDALARAYRLLETTPTATPEEVAKAYRRQLSRHHPDKLQAQGKSKAELDGAKVRTQAIIEAYELIRERRGSVD